MRAALTTVWLLCLVAAITSATAAAVARVPADQMATSTELSSSSMAVISSPTEAESRSIRPAALPRQRHRVRPLQESRAMQWVGVGTPPPNHWHVPKPPVTPAWRFQPGISSGSSFWPDIVQAMGSHTERTASDKPVAKPANATNNAKVPAKAAAPTANTTRQAHARAAAGTAHSKISHLNALTSNTYQSSASASSGPAWTPTKVAQPAAAAARLATDTSGMESVTQGPAAVSTSTEAAARRGQQAGGWLRVFSVQPQTGPVETRAARRQDDPDSATARGDLSGDDTSGQSAGGPQGHPTQQYRAEYVTELGDGVAIAGPQQVPEREVKTPPRPQFRPGRRQPTRRGFVDNMFSRLFGGSSPRPQRRRPSFTPHRHLTAPQQQLQQHRFQNQQQPQQENGKLQSQGTVKQQTTFQQQNNVDQSTFHQQQPKSQQLQQNGFQRLQNGFQQQQQTLNQQQLGQQQFVQQDFTGQKLTKNDQFTPSVPAHGATAGAGQFENFRPLQISPAQGQRQSNGGFGVASQFPVGSVEAVPVPAAARPTNARPSVPIVYEPASAPSAAATPDTIDYDPVRLPSVRQTLDEDAASRTAALTAAYLRSPQKTERRDDGTMVVTGALVDDSASDDVVELVIEYDNDLESIVDDLLREVRGEREPAPAASQLRRRPLIVQQLDQRLGLAHQPYYHIAMALHSLTQGAKR